MWRCLAREDVRRKTMNRIVISGLVAITGMLSSVARADNINVRVNGDLVRFYGTQPREIDGRIMVPLRGVLEQMGATVDWIASDQTVIATRGTKEITLPIGSRIAKVNGNEVQLDVPAMTLAGSTMVPLRFVSEALGADVVWLSRTQTVMIDSGNSESFRAYRRPPPAVDVVPPRSDYIRPERRRVIIESGSVIPVRLDDRLNSRDSNPGDRFTATVESGREDCGLPVGTKFEGVIREAVPSRNGKPGVLDVDFRQIIFPDGRTRPLVAGLTSMDDRHTTRNSDGKLIAKSGRGNERLKWVGIGAGAGLLIGTLTKGNALVDTILGGGAGYLYNELQRKGAGDVDVRAGTEMGVRLDQQLAFFPDRR
jgi:hypothetical protein